MLNLEVKLITDYSYFDGQCNGIIEICLPVAYLEDAKCCSDLTVLGESLHEEWGLIQGNTIKAIRKYNANNWEDLEVIIRQVKTQIRGDLQKIVDRVHQLYRTIPKTTQEKFTIFPTGD